MIRIPKIIILLIIVASSIGSCSTNPGESQKNTEAIEQANKILDKIEIQPDYFYGSGGPFDVLEYRKQYILNECHVLVENPDVALPIMFKRLDNKKTGLYGLGIYFMVFEEIKSPETIPYIVNYISSLTQGETEYCEKIRSCLEDDETSFIGDPLGTALTAAKKITHPLEFIDKNKTLFDQRKNIADKLNRWYEEYKKAKNK